MRSRRREDAPIGGRRGEVFLAADVAAESASEVRHTGPLCLDNTKINNIMKKDH